LLSDPALPGEDTSDLSVRYRREAVAYARAHESRLPVVAVARVARSVDLYGLHDLVHAEVGEERARWEAWAGIVSWWLLAPIAAIGWWKQRRTLGWVLAVPAITVVVTAVAFYGSDRLRISLEPVVVICAAMALAQFGVVRRQIDAFVQGREALS
jgi:hypothetical protein